MRKKFFIFTVSLIFLFVIGSLFNLSLPAAENVGVISDKTAASVMAKLSQKYGAAQAHRIKQGVKRAAFFWRQEDGTEKDFAEFCVNNFIGDPKKLTEVFNRYENNFEVIYGYTNIISRNMKWPIDVDTGEILPVDYLFAEFSPSAHISDDFFKTKVAFLALLNFPSYSLSEKTALSSSWDRLAWAKARLADNFIARVPAQVEQYTNTAYLKADDYISAYNIYMNNIIDAKGERVFPKDLKLISHWGLRDYLKQLYNDKNGFPKQKTIQLIMERIISQEIPQSVINNPNLDWNPVTNEVYKNAVKQKEKCEQDTRYKQLLSVFNAERLQDPYYPQNDTLIKRRFNMDREIPEEKVEKLFISVLSSPAAKDAGKYLEKRLGRKLEPFDIWYRDFSAGKVYKQEDLDALCSKLYPTTAAFQKDIPNILQKLGFTPEKAALIASKINVDPARGAGHALGSRIKCDNAHLRTRVTDKGFNYQSFNIACHELGHCVEQVISLNLIDHTLLAGVPNTAFTEAFAFMFQARDKELLGIYDKNDPLNAHTDALSTFWQTYEMSGVALVDMKIWRWMYEHPKATPKELKSAMLSISKEVWNKYYEPVLGVKDCPLLSVYSHIICYGLYTPDYPLGFIIQFQLKEYFKDKNLAQEMERVCKQGNITPTAWMTGAVGQDISAEPLLSAADKALKELNKCR